MKFKSPKTEKSYLSQPSFGILSIAVSPDFQRNGIGKKLMDLAESSAKEKNFNKMHLTVGPKNAAAVQFYEGLGWKKFFIRDSVWSGRMEKQL